MVEYQTLSYKWNEFWRSLPWGSFCKWSLTWNVEIQLGK
jgi:hypothetical protein